MKLSPMVVIFLALMLLSPAHAGDLVIETKSERSQDLHQMYFGRGKFASIENGRTDMYIDGRMCTIFRHEDQSKTMNDCETMWGEFRRMRDDMMKKHGMTQADLSKNMPKGSAKVRKIASRVIANHRSDCYELGQYYQLTVCLSKELHQLIRTTTSMNPQEWAKKFQMDDISGQNLTDKTLAKLERDAFPMYRADILSAMGMNSFVFNSLPDAKKAEMVKNARADMKQNGGPPPEMEVVSVEKKSMKINRHTSYKKLTLKEFIGSGMGGGANAGGGMSSGDMQTGMGGDVNLQELLEQQGTTDTDVTTTTKKKKKKKKETLMQKMKRIAKEKKDQLLKSEKQE